MTQPMMTQFTVVSMGLLSKRVHVLWFVIIIWQRWHLSCFSEERCHLFQAAVMVLATWKTASPMLRQASTTGLRSSKTHSTS